MGTVRKRVIQIGSSLSGGDQQLVQIRWPTVLRSASFPPSRLLAWNRKLPSSGREPESNRESFFAPVLIDRECCVPHHNSVDADIHKRQRSALRPDIESNLSVASP
jgi:hypothetical protein